MTALCLALLTAPSVGTAGRWLTVDGRPALLLGDSITQAWAEQNADFETHAWLDDVAARGLNAVMIWSYIGAGDPTADPRLGYQPETAQPWPRVGEGYDLTRLDDVYLDRLDALIAAAGERGLVVILTIHDGWTKTRFAGHPFNAALGGPLADRRQYVEIEDPDRDVPGELDPAWPRRRRHQYLIERFVGGLAARLGRHPHLILEVLNEGEWYDQDELERFQRHTARVLRARCDRPIMINLDHTRSALREAADIISLHKPNWTRETTAADAFEVFAAEWRRDPAKPLVFSEPVPEYRGDAADHDALGRLMWGTLLAGGSFMLQNDVAFGWAPRSAMRPLRPVAAALLDRLGAARRLLDGLDLTDARPDRLSLVSPAGWELRWTDADDVTLLRAPR